MTKSLSHVQLFVTAQTVAHQAPLSMELSRQEHWVGCHSLLQGIFPTQGSNLGLPHCRQIIYHLSHQGSPKMTKNPIKIGLSKKGTVLAHVTGKTTEVLVSG